MRLLIIKLSSLGDVIHALPALSDAAQQFPGLRCDWVIEEGFAEIPSWHPAVEKVFPVALRRWRKQFWRRWPGAEWRDFKQQVTANEYDYVIDAQGLLKSAWLSRLANGPRHGLNRQSARESLTHCLYQHTHAVPWGQHAVTRVRQLFAATLGYAVPDSLPDYGLNRLSLPCPDTSPVLIFFHGASWRSKCWPEQYWVELAQQATNDGFQVRLPWGGSVERARAQRIANAVPTTHVIAHTDLRGMAEEISRAQAVVGVDTGLSHLAAALGVPSVTIYGATRPDWTGTFGPKQQHTQSDFPCSPCLKRECRFTGNTSVIPACYARTPPDSIHTLIRDLI